jgi:hypothetical protein
MQPTIQQSHIMHYEGHPFASHAIDNHTHLFTVMHSTIIHRQSNSLSPQEGFGAAIAHAVTAIVGGRDTECIKVCIFMCNKGIHRTDTCARSSRESCIHIMVHQLVSDWYNRTKIGGSAAAALRPRSRLQARTSPDINNKYFDAPGS